ncbi:MAG: hypothetical protein JKY88_10140 [Pseudomonadales bacterium]|nr:hypothetical protein [Pseudomonadales bacterium]
MNINACYKPLWLYNPILFFLSIACISAGHSEAAEIIQQETYRLYESHESKSLTNRTRKSDLKIIEIDYLKENFEVEANLLYKMLPLTSTVSRDLYVVNPKNGDPVNEDGWWGSKNLYFWENDKNSSRKPLELRFREQEPAGGGDRSVSHIFDYDHVIFEYKSIGDIPSCSQHVEIEMIGKPNNNGRTYKLTASTENALDSTVVDSVLISKSTQWLSKDYAYLASRMFGFKGDQFWRYSQDLDNTVLQRRFHQPLGMIEKIFVVLDNDSDFENINITVSLEDNYAPGDLLDLGMKPKVSVLPDGRVGVLLDIRMAIQRTFPLQWAQYEINPDSYQFYLQEIFLFIPGKAYEVVRNNPLKAIEFWGIDENLVDENKRVVVSTLTAIPETGEFSNSARMPLSSTYRTLSSDRFSLEVDTAEIIRGGVLDLDEIRVYLVPPFRNDSCAIQVEKVSLVNRYKHEVPAYVKTINSWQRRLEKSANNVYGEVRVPGILDYFPFSTVGIPTEPDKIKNVNNEVLIERSLMSSTGTLIYKLRKRGKVPAQIPLSAKVDDGLLMLGGLDGGVGILWPVEKRIDADTNFFFGLEYGVGQIKSANLFIHTVDGGVIDRKIVFNQAMTLVDTVTDIKSIEIELIPTSSASILALRDLLLFSPRAITYQAAELSPLPTYKLFKPIPVSKNKNTDRFYGQAGRINWIANSRESKLQFESVFEPKIDWVQGINLKYKFPTHEDFRASCAIRLVAHWENGSFDYQMCGIYEEGEVRIPISKLIDTEHHGRNMGKLVSIDWFLDWPSSAENVKPAIIDFNYSIEGFAMLSARDELRLQALMFLEGRPVFGEFKRAKLDIRKGLLNHIVLGMNSSEIYSLARGRGNIEPLKSAIAELDAVNLVSTHALEKKQKMSDTESSNYRLFFPWILFGLCLFISFVALVFFRWRRKLILFFYLVFSAVQLKVRAGFRRGLIEKIDQSPFQIFNLMLGFTSLVFGSLYAGIIGLDLDGFIILASALLVSLGSYHHRKGWQPVYESRMNHSSFHLFNAITLMSLSCGIWFVGLYISSKLYLLGFMPLAALGYLYSFDLWRYFSHMVALNRRWITLIFWLIVMFTFFKLGMSVTVAINGNAYITLADLAIVFIFRSSLLILEEPFRKYFPRLATSIYEGVGNLFFASCLIGFLFTMLAHGWGNETIAERLAVASYFALFIGFFLETITLFKADSIGEK